MLELYHFDRSTAARKIRLAIVDWGDTTSQKRVELGTQAFPKLKQLWDGKLEILPDTAHRPVNSLK